MGQWRLLALVVNILAAAPAFAVPEVQLYGIAECPPCMRIKRILNARQISFTAHDLRKPDVERLYVERFGRGPIPVVVVAGTVIRGDYPERVLAEIERAAGSEQTRGAARQTAPRIQQIDRPAASPAAAVPDPAPQRCENGQPLESFYTLKLPYVEERLGAGTIPAAHPAEVVLDLCYGAAGIAVCPEGSVPFRSLQQLETHLLVTPTFGRAQLRLPLACRIVKY